MISRLCYLAALLVALSGCGIFRPGGALSKTWDPEFDYPFKVNVPVELLEYHGPDEQIAGREVGANAWDALRSITPGLAALSGDTVGQIATTIVGIVEAPGAWLETGLEKTRGRSAWIYSENYPKKIMLGRRAGFVGPVLEVSFYRPCPEHPGNEPEDDPGPAPPNLPPP